MKPAEIQAVQAKFPDARTLALWTGVWGPPSAFLADLCLSYALANRVCLGGRGFLNLIALGALVAIAASAWLAFRGAPLESADAARPARRLLEQLGLWSCVLFAVAVIALAVPRLFLDPCAQY
jgi:hypothetical protein